MKRFASLLGILAVLAACGGGGGNGPTEPPPTPPPAQSLTFTPAGSPGSDALVLTRQGAGSDTLMLALEAREVDNVYGVFFDLAFPAAVLDFQSADAGSFLTAGGADVSLQVAEQDGNLVMGISRLGLVGGVSGSGTVLTLTFQVRAAGSGPLDFARNGAIDPNGGSADVSWFGGSVTSVR
ncbi:MAG TPA: cohesin domain-containing protein [Thermoanaerobaculia bacterium]|nr:cohesin domain-containing protein [Thermoanaerobaculia bacterium]